MSALTRSLTAHTSEHSSFRQAELLASLLEECGAPAHQIPQDIALVLSAYLATEVELAPYVPSTKDKSVSTWKAIQSLTELTEELAGVFTLVVQVHKPAAINLLRASLFHSPFQPDNSLLVLQSRDGPNGAASAPGATAAAPAPAEAPAAAAATAAAPAAAAAAGPKDAQAAFLMSRVLAYGPAGAVGRERGFISKLQGWLGGGSSTPEPFNVPQTLADGAFLEFTLLITAAGRARLVVAVDGEVLPEAGLVFSLRDVSDISDEATRESLAKRLMRIDVNLHRPLESAADAAQIVHVKAIGFSVIPPNDEDVG